MAGMMTRVLSWPTLLFTFATWAVFLAGIACLQHNCADGTTGTGQVPYGSTPSTSTFGLNGVFGWSPTVPCTRLFRFYWFIIAFLFVTLLGAFIAAAPKYGLSSSRPFWIGMFSLNALLYMIASEAMLSALDVTTFTVGQPQSCMRTAAAGAIMTVAGCIFLLLTIGTDWENRGRHRTGEERKAPAGVGYRRGEEGLPTTAGTPAGTAGPVTYTGSA
ncbi:membrane transporter [Raphidocelis subcapitata]|uniref:Membrane transporter n=1 Tax=Raphidocelis subcapitata TaxID=307507 RepID=A0A2V0PI82_9CHLO|nr:membrane transporter [Raphidocelis subcapitata]|eukprot:GBF99279.1 membrane transporter [Raphidocelis subcapitata]